MGKKKIMILVMMILLLIMSGCTFSVEVDPDKENSDQAVGKEINEKNNMGINLWGVTPWAGVRVFVDMMKESRAQWLSPTNFWDIKSTVPMDELCYPKTDASKIIWEASVSTNGTYFLVFTGKAENIDVFGLAGSIKDIKYNEESNKTTAKVEIIGTSGTGGLVFKGTKRTANSDVETGITDVHLYRPGYPTDGSVTFTNEFISAVKKFQCVRFMDWNVTNGNPCIKWEERTLPENASQIKEISNIITNGEIKQSGVAYEYMIQLCNEVNSDLWINIPINADDEYISNLAKLIHYGRKGSNGVDYKPLNSNLKVYIEYGNEIWNWAYGFYNYSWIYNLTAAAQKDTTHPIVYDGNNSDIYTGMFRYVGWRTVAISNIFREEFGDKLMMTRIRPVIESQLGNTVWIKAALEFIEGYYSISRNGEPARNVNYFIYGGGGSAYYGVNTDITDAEYLMQHHFDTEAYPAKDYIKSLKMDAIIVKDYGIKRVAYEGGTSLDYMVPNTSNWLLTEEQQKKLNEDSRMKDMVIKCQNAWSEIGGDLLCYYVIGRGTPWEFTSDSLMDKYGIYALTYPKMQAIEELNDSKKSKVTFGNEIPNEIVLRKIDMSTILHTSAWSNTLDGLDVYDGENCMRIAVNSKKIGKYKIVFKGRVYGNPLETPEKGVTEVRINGEKIGKINIPVNGEGEKQTAIVDATAIETYLPSGLSVVRFTNKNRFAIYSVKFIELVEITETKNKLKKKSK